MRAFIFDVTAANGIILSDRSRRNGVICRSMVEWLRQLAHALSLRFKFRARLEAGKSRYSQTEIGRAECVNRTRVGSLRT